MDNKIKGVLLGVAAIILWFMPLAAWQQQFMGQLMTMQQSGYHIGGIAYLLLVSSVAYTALSWFEQHQLRIISASVATGISLLILVMAGSNVAWGLILLIAVSSTSVWFSVADNKKANITASAT